MSGRLEAPWSATGGAKEERRSSDAAGRDLQCFDKRDVNLLSSRQTNQRNVYLVFNGGSIKRRLSRTPTRVINATNTPAFRPPTSAT